MEFHISEAEGGVIGCRANIFPGSKEKLEGDADQICNGMEVFGNGDNGTGV
jgi:hypothetical protein